MDSSLQLDRSVSDPLECESSFWYARTDRKPAASLQKRKQLCASLMRPTSPESRINWSEQWRAKIRVVAL